MARDDGQVFAPVTRTEWADYRLRHAILSGELLPGEKLVATSLAKSWDISPTPLREAFVRLAGSGLVELTPQRGARVAPLSVEEAAEIFEVRLLIEPAALERSILGSDDAHIDEVRRILAELEAALDSDETERVTEVHRRFHAALLARAPGTWLAKFCNILSEHSGRYQLLSPLKDEQTAVKMHQHEQLAQALTDRDVDTATKVLTEHLGQSLERIHSWAEALEETDPDAIPAGRSSQGAATSEKPPKG